MFISSGRQNLRAAAGVRSSVAGNHPDDDVFFGMVTEVRQVNVHGPVEVFGCRLGKAGR